jgi:hypothetical protein
LPTKTDKILTGTSKSTTNTPGANETNTNMKLSLVLVLVSGFLFTTSAADEPWPQPTDDEVGEDEGDDDGHDHNDDHPTWHPSLNPASAQPTDDMISEDDGDDDDDSVPPHPPTTNPDPTPTNNQPSSNPASNQPSDEGDNPLCIGGGCTADVTLKRWLGSRNDYDYMPISIISQDGGTVTFEIAHQWGNIHLDHFFVQYNAPGGGHVCHKTDNFTDDGTCVLITAKCMSNHVAAITLTAVDPLVYSTTTDDPGIPRACCDAYGIDLASDDKNVVKYVFELHCDPEECD